MISFDFEYYKSKSVNDAISTYSNLEPQGKKVIYYSGGTEIISMARANMLNFDAVIDIKEIPECNTFDTVNNRLVIGAAVTLTKICEENLFPFLTKAAKAAADHTSRDKITIGGNICGEIPYHEAILPLLLCDSYVTLAGKNEVRTVPINQVFDQKLKHKKDELLIQIMIDKKYIDMPYEFVKRTKMEEIDYPVVTLAMIKRDNRIRAAFSGVCEFPFRSLKIEGYLNDNTVSVDERIEKSISSLPAPIVSNLQASAEYREFVFRNMLLDAINKIGGVA